MSYSPNPKINQSFFRNAPNIKIYFPHHEPTSPREMVLWAVGGGKGGSGKSILSTNLAVCLSWLKQKVVLIDMDLGGSNLHTMLGIEAPHRTLSDFILGKYEKIEDILQPTILENLNLISAAQDSVGIAHLGQVQKTRLLRKLSELKVDFAILDLGAGTSPQTIDFFLMAQKKILVVTPEPTSIENAYRFLKLSFYQMLERASESKEVRNCIEEGMEAPQTNPLSTPKSLLKEIYKISPSQALFLENQIENFKVHLIVNQVRGVSEADIGSSMSLVCQKFFGMDLEFDGYLPYENTIWQSVRRRVPFVLDAPHSLVVTHLETILKNLLRSRS